MPSLTHIAMHVADLPACVDFYCRYCGMTAIHERHKGSSEVVWLAEPGREQDFILVLLSGGRQRPQAADDYSHPGFAVDKREKVDEIATFARQEGRLVWEPRQEPWPVGYYCGVRDPNGTCVEFSYGQPLGPGAEALRQQQD